MQKSSRIPIILSLASLSALGPLATDMYVPAIPDIARTFAVDVGQVQMSVTTFFLGFTLGQLFWGPISDRYGRKTAALFALALFLAASFACVVAGDIQSLLLFRFLQGIGGAAGAVLGISVVRDLFSGVDGARMLGLISLVMGVAPVVAPLAGSLVMHVSHWESIFVALGVFALLSFLLVLLKLPETRAPQHRQKVNPLTLLKVYLSILRKPNFTGYALPTALMQGGFFAYIAGASTVMMSIYGLSAIEFSLLFAVNAIGLGLGVRLNSWLISRISPRITLRLAIAANAVAGLSLVVLQLLGLADLLPVSILLFVMVGTMGGILPTGNMLAMEDNHANSGMAAALIGAMGFGAGAFSGGILGALADGTALPLFAIMAVCGVLGLIASMTIFPAAVDAWSPHADMEENV
jgi:MFS transporter, DHA1 family, multidrug resistance protein